MKQFGGRLLALFVALFVSTCLLSSCSNANSTIETESGHQEPLRVGMAPYQDLSLLVNEKNLGLEQKYGTKIELLTMPWEEIVTAMASAGPTIDAGFVSFSDYLNKIQNMNGKSDDPIIFVYPTWIFRAGTFITFNPNVPALSPENINNTELVKKFLSYKIAVIPNEVSQFLLFKLADKAGVKHSQLNTIKVAGYNDALLAAENGSVDISYAGITQKAEAVKQHGRVVLTMDTLNFADGAGFACKESVYKKRRKDIDSLVRMWFDCVNYVTSDYEHHSGQSLAYLKANAATSFTVQEFKLSLVTVEYVPNSLADCSKMILSKNGKYSIDRIWKEIGGYLLETGAIKTAPPSPHVIQLSGQ